MTFVDDSLLGAGTIRSAKAGAKGAGLAAIGNGSKNDAFESAVADAGKKKQAAPQISIGAKFKDDTEQSLQSRTVSSRQASIADGAAVAKEPVRPALVADADLSEAGPGVEDTVAELPLNALRAEKGTPSLPVQNQALKDAALLTLTGSQTFREAKQATTETSPAAAVQQQEEPVSTAILDTLAKTGDSSAVDAPSLPSLQKLVELVKDGKLVQGKVEDGKKPVSIDAKTTSAVDKTRAKANDTEGAARAVDTTGDVGQLLAMLGAQAGTATQTTAEPSTADTPPMPSAMISEFQALADRAGKAKAETRQAGAVALNGPAAALKADASAVRNATEAGSDQIFRFARADGKGQAVSMTMSTDGDKPSAKIEAATVKADASAGKAETVTVLESRRYLGIAANTNSQAVATTIAGSSAWAKAMQPSSGLSSPDAASAAGKVVNTLKIQMHPIDLGTVTATLRLKDDELHVDLKVETGEAFRQLSDDQNAMVKALRAQGFAVDQINITFNATSDSSSGNTGSQQAQTQAGQQGRDMSGDGGASQGRGRNDDGSQARSGERWTGNEGFDEAVSAEPAGAGHTYM